MINIYIFNGSTKFIIIFARLKVSTCMYITALVARQQTIVFTVNLIAFAKDFFITFMESFSNNSYGVIDLFLYTLFRSHNSHQNQMIKTRVKMKIYISIYILIENVTLMLWKFMGQVLLLCAQTCHKHRTNVVLNSFRFKPK